MEVALSAVLNGLAFGGLIFLLAAGLSVIFGLMDVLNLAHGSFYMLGAYVGLTVLAISGNFWLALVAAPLALGIIGALIEILFFRRIYRQGHLMQVLLTFGFTLVFVDLIRWRFGPQTHSLPTPAGLDGSVRIFGIYFATYKVFVILFATVVALALLLAWRKSRVGAILRAGVADREMLGLLGIDLSRIFTATFAFGAALAGLAGVIVGPYLGVYPGMDESILVLVLVVVVVGGLGSIEGAILGSLLIGLANAIGPLVLGGFEAASIFAVMAIVLLVRPQGLLGRRQ